VIYDFGPFRVDARRFELLRDGAAVPLKRKAVQALVALIERRGELVTKNELIAAVWGEHGTTTNNLSQHIFMLRDALGDSGGQDAYVLTVPRVGYRFVAAVTHEEGESAGKVIARHYCANAEHLWQMRTHASISSAASLYQQALQEYPRCADAYAGLATCHFLLAEYMFEPQRESLVIAEREAFRALEIDPHHALAHVVLGVCAAQLRYAWREAEHLLLSAIRHRPDLLWAHVHLVEQYIFEGKLSNAWQALAHAQSLAAADDPFPRLPLLRGSLHYFSASYGAAIAELGVLVSDYPSYALARYLLAKAFLGKGDYEQAQFHVDEILRGGYDPLRPGQPHVRERAMTLAVLVLKASGDYAGARRAARELGAFAASRSISNVCLAVASFGAGDINAAMRFIELAVKNREALVANVVPDPLLVPLHSHRMWPRLLAELRLTS